MRNALKSTIDILIAVGVGFLGYACVLFIRYNAPIIKHDFYFAAALALNLLLILISLSGSGKKYSGGITIFNFFFSIIISALIFYSILDAVVYHRFQPIYQYDWIIYAAIIGFALLVTAVLIQSFQALRHIARPMVYPKYIWIGLLIVLLPIQFYGFRLLKKDADYTYIETEPTILFDSADSGYSSFRKPSLLIIHAGETLADGTILTQDRVIVFAEVVSGQTVNQRKTRLIGKMSLNGGTTWQDSSINGDYADIMDGAGNAVSVFDAETGEAFVFYIKEAYPDDYRTYLMKSRDGGISWETAGYVFDGVSSPETRNSNQQRTLCGMAGCSGLC